MIGYGIMNENPCFRDLLCSLPQDQQGTECKVEVRTTKPDYIPGNQCTKNRKQHCTTLHNMIYTYWQVIVTPYTNSDNRNKEALTKTCLLTQI